MNTHTLKDLVSAFRAEYNAEADKAKAATKVRADKEAADHAVLIGAVNLFADELVPLIEGKRWRVERGNTLFASFQILKDNGKINHPDVALSVTAQYRKPGLVVYSVHEPYSAASYTPDRGEALVWAAKKIGQQLAREDQAK